jgi:hypothetical protein
MCWYTYSNYFKPAIIPVKSAQIQQEIALIATLLRTGSLMEQTSVLVKLGTMMLVTAHKCVLH